ncbi:MAG: ABC transporter permease, partial [Ktedonobacteraceae bacterium]
LPGVTNPAALVDCNRVVNFLKSDAHGRQYARNKGGTNQALQNFIVPTQGGGDAQRVIFLVGFFLIIFGLINGALEIVKETAIYQRERAVNLGLLPYMFSKIFVLGLFALLQSILMLLVVQAFEPLSQGVFLPVFLEIYITLALVALSGVMFGLLLSSISSNEDTANNLLPLIIIPQVILSGSIIPLKDWSTLVLATIVPIRWALIAIGSSLGLHSDKIDGSKLFGDDPVYHGTLFSIYSSSDATHRILLAWGALAAIILILTLIVGFFLKRKDIRS